MTARRTIITMGRLPDGTSLLCAGTRCLEWRQGIDRQGPYVSWLETLSSTLGTGTGGAGLAVLIYTGSIALEKEMREEAKHEIAGFINRTNVLPDSQVVANFISHAFEAVFGSRHWTLKCMRRSFVASIVVCLSLMGLFWLKYPHNFDLVLNALNSGPFWAAGISAAIMMVWFSCIPDYMSLFKGRFILAVMTRSRDITRILLLVLLDISASSCIYFIALTAAAFVISADRHSIREAADAAVSAERVIISGFGILFGRSPLHPDDIGFAVYLLSTMMTSMWAVMILLASLTVRLLSTVGLLMRLVRWAFDMDAHPVRKLGMVSAAIIWLGSVIYGVI
jgi:hypothetical protein